MVHHLVVTLNRLEAPLSCNPCYQSRLLQADFAKSEAVLSDLVAPQSLHRQRHPFCSLLCLTACLSSAQCMHLVTNVRLASTNTTFGELRHSAINDYFECYSVLTTRPESTLTEPN